MDEAKAQARGLLPGSTPALDSTSGFSPAPKPGESAFHRVTLLPPDVSEHRRHEGLPRALADL